MKLEELARLAGVSKATANIILSGKADRYKISHATRNKVMVLVEKYHYTSDSQPDTASTNNLLALIIPSLTHHGFARLTHEIETLGRERGYQWLLCCTQDDPEKEKAIIKGLQSIKIQAVMTVSALWEDGLYRTMQQRGVEIITVERQLPDSPIPSITCDEQRATKELCQLLLTSKPEQEPLVYFGGISTMACSEQRLAGIHLALSESAHPSQDIQIFHKDYSATAGLELASDYFSKHQQLPNSLFTGSFTLMEGVLQYIRQYPERRPERLNWATFGDSYILDLLPFTVLSCRQEYGQIASQFFSMLKNKTSQPSVIPLTLVQRNLPASQ